MGESWDEHAATWDEGGPVVYADAAAASLREQAEALALPLSGARVLDFGCGTGLLAERIAPLSDHIVALDPSAGMIARLAAKIDAGLAGVEALQGVLVDEVLKSPAFAHSFDLVVASSVCAFLEDYPGTVRQIARLLRPGGAFVQWDWERRAEDEQPFGLSRVAVREALAGAGLDVLVLDRGFEVAYGEMTMAPLMAIGRLA